MKKKKIILIILFLFCITCVSTWAHYILSDTPTEMVKQETLSQMEADEYLLSVQQNTSDSTNSESNSINSSPEQGNDQSNSDLDYNDNVLYTYHTVNEAWGYVDCVIEIPSIELRQCVFSGTPAQLEHDLAHWLTVTCRSDYVLGSTHYAVYIHNPRDRSLKISSAQDKTKVGDYLILTQNKIVYFYEITGVFGEWREICASKYANDMTLSRDLFYLFTCGRDNWQGQNLVIEGKLYNTYHVDDWNKNKESYIREYKGIVEEHVVNDINSFKESLNLSIQAKDGIVTVNITTPTQNQATDCTIGIVDEDGFLIDDEIEYNGHSIDIPFDKEGVFTIGVYQNKTDFESPDPYTLQVTKETKNISIVSVEEFEQKKDDDIKKIRILAMILVLISYGIIIFELGNILFSKNKK